MVTVYKVVKNDAYGRLVSALALAENNLLAIYPIGESVSAPVGRLFAFATAEDAHRFRNQLSTSSQTFSVYEAEADSAYPVTTKIPRYNNYLSVIRDWWNGKWGNVYDIAPKGTVTCGTLTLRRVAY